ncbi:c-type cytochrome [Sphingomonas sp. 1P06PA]|uniref:c-type cytochrome n=1 Tax=Sphingomonas sp. 1P06PA TaxID=554121 RepID=UPI0039A72607
MRHIFPSRLRQWVGPLIVAILAAAILAIAVAASGLLGFAATTPDSPIVTRLVHGVFKRSVAAHAGGTPRPADLDDPSRLMAGAGMFALSCARCHGSPGIGQNPVALSMSPRPQYLPAVVGQFSDDELFWIVRHGVKLSAMPAWPAAKRSDEIWSVVAFLRQLPRMPEARYRQLAYGDPFLPPTSKPLGFGPILRATPYNLRNRDEWPADEHRYTAPASGLDDLAYADDPRPACARCHGADGTGRAGSRYPNLAIQDPRYLRDSLRAFAAGRRSSGPMQIVASQLSPAQIDALAVHYGGKAAPAPLPTVDGSLGARIASQGIDARGVGACAGCHGVEGSSPEQMPRLAGQNRRYLIDQMHLFAGEGRGRSGATNPMRAEVHRLTEAEIIAVSDYYAARPPS